MTAARKSLVGRRGSSTDELTHNRGVVRSPRAKHKIPGRLFISASEERREALVFMASERRRNITVNYETPDSVIARAGAEAIQAVSSGCFWIASRHASLAAKGGSQ